MFSHRYQRPLVLTRHAKSRMDQRQISLDELLWVVDSGETKFKDETHLWAFKKLPHRNDNLICAVLVLEDVVVVKTVLHQFVLEI